MDRADITVETLLKIILGLVILWLVLEVLGTLVDFLTGVFWFLQPLIVLVVLVLIVLWLLDRI